MTPVQQRVEWKLVPRRISSRLSARAVSPDSRWTALPGENYTVGMNDAEFSDSADAGAHSQQELAEFRNALLSWYAQHQRDLPWRKSCDPYRVWLSEIMLQQTTVAAVIPYFERFLARFPNLAELAASPEEDVLRMWEGLGYYSRARNIHRTARVLIDEWNGEFPRSVEELRQLPGIGRYTAGAIVSFAFQKPAPIVEANTQRLYARLLAWDQPLSRSASQTALWDFAGRLVSEDQPGGFNQALMDLGSRVCTPAEPDCAACPVQVHCRAYQQGQQLELPVTPPRRPPTPVTHWCVVLQQGERVLLVRYPPGERWAGLWDFPRWENNDIPHAPFPARQRSQASLFPQELPGSELFPTIEADFEQRFGTTIRLTRPLATIKHAVTRYSVTLVCLEATCRSRSLKQGAAEQQWATPTDLASLPLSTTGRKIANLLSR